ncbi:MAG: T9SS type A sorting domain-containing protein [Bacteroidota bacterium]
MKKPFTLILILLLIGQAEIKAQSTFASVYNLLQANCSGSACHNGTNANIFNVDTNMAELYAQLVGVSPTNPAAAAKGDKLVDPGYPLRSFLLRKMAHSLSSDLDLNQPSEGNDMPSGLLKLKDEEIELVRQWILFGADDTGTAVDPTVLFDFYNGMGMGVSQMQPPPAPNPNDGIQVHGGPYFLRPGEEREFFHKFHLRVPDNLEVYKIVPTMNAFSHHFILYEYLPTGYQGVAEGSRPLGNTIDISNFFNTSFIGTWQYYRELELPQGTGYFWNSDTRLDLNYHIHNYSPDSIIAAEVYINIYYRPKQSATVQMHAGLTSYGKYNPRSLIIPNNATDTVFTNPQTAPNETRYYWLFQSHTHKLGKDFDIYMRNADGTKGVQIYEGFYNQDYTFDQGFFDWQHPAARVFDPMLEVDMDNGLIHEAKFYNNGPDTVRFGFTTADEMFITYFQYTTQLPGSLGMGNDNDVDLKTVNVFPNPFNDKFTLFYTVKNSGLVTVDLFDLYGKKLQSIINKHQLAGTYEYTFDSKANLPRGVYLVGFSTNGTSVTKKVVQLD